MHCVNTTRNGNNCKSPEKIDDFMANTIMEMRLEDSSIKMDFNYKVDEKPLVKNEDLI